MLISWGRKDWACWTSPLPHTAASWMSTFEHYFVFSHCKEVQNSELINSLIYILIGVKAVLLTQSSKSPAKTQI